MNRLPLINRRYFILTLVCFFSFYFLGCTKKSDINNALMSAVKQGNNYIVEKLLKDGADVNAVHSQDGCSPLIIASAEGYNSTVKLLLNHGANVNARCKDNSTALLIASMKGYLAVVESLLEKGADTKIRDSKGVSPLFAAIQSGHESSAILLIEKGADFNEKLENGNNALIEAVKLGRTAVAKVLLKKGADKNEVSGDGYTALKWARELGYTRVAAMLDTENKIESKITGEKEIKFGNNWKYLFTERNVTYFYSIASMKNIAKGNLKTVLFREFHSNTETYNDILIEIDCAAMKYRHLSNTEHNLSGKKIRDIPGDSHTLKDGGDINSSTAIYMLWHSACR